ncbi:hypothetical protein CKM354_000036700 [Cercospora kikuchii]|uniref:Mitochondrial carrier n=1 Tax=Cercospora kikuchii TaxID=84275 RepID=A0A9P3F759_9PEZI|nr:uncharacterized protein CKM354_000036700 [Cercospora kikuchii]GIZ36901.1 hypothetical protein CKM354_000036700 [Cercospora kikuchii]
MSGNDNSSSARGFFAGAFSGVAKVSTGHPFDTIKVRLQTTDVSRFNGPWTCFRQTLSQEGIRGLYKGFTPPLAGFVVMDSLLLGSFSMYRNFLNRSLDLRSPENTGENRHTIPADRTSVMVSFLSGGLAGWTVSFIAAPIEHVKARLQVQYHTKIYSGPIDCVRKIYRDHGVYGVYRGLPATIIFRSFFAVFWASYDVLNRRMQVSTDMSLPLINFMAAGVAAQLYWLTGYPTDVIKQRVMTEPLGIRGVHRRTRWIGIAKKIYQESGWKGFWRGFVPCFLRAFPANAMSIMTFEAVMRATVRKEKLTTFDEQN